MDSIIKYQAFHNPGGSPTTEPDTSDSVLSNLTPPEDNSNSNVIYVDDNASEGGDGSSWSTAHKYLQDALAVAESGDEIWVAEGTYKPDQGAGKTAGDRTASFNLVSGVGMYGGFSGTETTRDPQGDKNRTILSGEIDANSTFWSLHIIKGQNLSYNNTIEGFSIKNSNANGSSNDAYGGGMYLVNSMPYIKDCYFKKCFALNGGGAIYCSGHQQGTIVIIDSVFDENSANNGGAIFGNADITNVVFSENSAYAGGCIHGSYFVVRNSIFLQNAGVFQDKKTIASAVSISDWKKSYISRFSNCLFYNNKNAFKLDSRAYLRNCTFYSDLDDEGYDVSVVLDNHPILPNNQMTLVHSIFWRGNASSNESIFMHDPSSNLLTNLAANYSYPSNSPDALGFPNLIFGNQGDLGNTITTDPLFKNIDNPIGDDGIWFTKDDGFNLLESSSCIDAGYSSSDYPGGYSSYIQFLPDIDLAGYKRTQGQTVDLGAYEYGDELMPTAAQYKISAIASTGGAVSGSGTFDEDASVTLTATPSNSGYIFSGWSGDASGITNPLSITMDSNKNITANFIDLGIYKSLVDSSFWKFSTRLGMFGVIPFEEGLWIWRPNEDDWMFTSHKIFPYAFSLPLNSPSSFIYMEFDEGSNKRGKYYSYEESQWIDLPYYTSSPADLIYDPLKSYASGSVVVISLEDGEIYTSKVEVPAAADGRNGPNGINASSYWGDFTTTTNQFVADNPTFLNDWPNDIDTTELIKMYGNLANPYGGSDTLNAVFAGLIYDPTKSYPAGSAVVIDLEDSEIYTAILDVPAAVDGRNGPSGANSSIYWKDARSTTKNFSNNNPNFLKYLAPDIDTTTLSEKVSRLVTPSSPATDSDGDGISDSKELEIGSNPNYSDKALINFIKGVIAEDPKSYKFVTEAVHENALTVANESTKLAVKEARDTLMKQIKAAPSAFDMVSKSEHLKALLDASASAEVLIEKAKKSAREEASKDFQDIFQNQDSNSSPYTSDWFYMPQRGWMWTNEKAFPWFRDANSSNWMYFKSGQEKPTFYHYGTKEWMTLE